MTGEAKAKSMEVITDIAINDAPRYLKQLCRHFGHKVPATFDETTGSVEFDEGTALLEATTPELLRVAIRASDAASAARYADVVERHLVKFAFRETLTIVWSDPGVVESNEVRTVSHP